MSNLPEEKANVRCNRCKCFRYPSQFLNDKGREMKTCKLCRNNGAKAREKNKCPHGKQKAQCIDCRGTQICDHLKRKVLCRDCKKIKDGDSTISIPV